MNAIEKLIETAESWDGYLEKRSNAKLESLTANAGSGNYTIFAQQYKDLWGDNFQAQPWCAVFVSVMFHVALDRELFPHFAYCPTGVNNFKKAGQWVTSLPKAGDVIFFKDSSGTACHVGIVKNVADGRVYTLEGNTSSMAGVVANGGCVARKSYALNYGRILGYGRPNYESEDNLMSKEYDELKTKIEELEKKIPAPPMIYNYIDNNMPDWARPTIQKLVDKGFLKGNEKGELNLNDEMLRIFVAHDRKGIYDMGVN